MPVYRLTPTNLDSPTWNCSTWREACLVYAASRQEARDAATSHFKIAASKTHDMRLPQSPWNNPALVRCDELANFTGEVPSEPGAVVLLPRDKLRR
jgi:hypothetical protein